MATIPIFMLNSKPRNSRLNGRERNIAYNFLVFRDGEQCKVCHKTPPFTKLDVEHSNGDPYYHNHKNLQLMCRSCNSRKNPRGKGRKGHDLVSLSLTAINACDPKPEDTKLHLKKKYLNEFLRYLEGEFENGEQLVYERVITNGAYKAGFASKKTIREYVELLACDDQDALLLKYKDTRSGVEYVSLRGGAGGTPPASVRKTFSDFRKKYCG
jgi:NAD-dependent dihydropyrimidine dehydrogenase PreA subunit